MFEYTGNCQCKAVSILFSCPKSLDEYQARVCDCDYCLKKKIAYLSDPQSILALSSKKPLKEEKQGSGQATFLSCANCLTTLAVAYITETSSLGSVNARCLDDFPMLVDSVLVSPKTLNSAEKAARWQTLWSKLLVTSS